MDMDVARTFMFVYLRNALFLQSKIYKSSIAVTQMKRKR